MKFEHLERWSNAQPRSQSRARIEASALVRFVPECVVTGVERSADGKSVSALQLSSADGSRRERAAASRVVIAAGGVESTRLLLNAEIRAEGDPVLGHNYMGHISGKIAGLVLSDPISAGRWISSGIAALMCAVASRSIPSCVGGSVSPTSLSGRTTRLSPDARHRNEFCRWSGWHCVCR